MKSYYLDSDSFIVQEGCGCCSDYVSEIADASLETIIEAKNSLLTQIQAINQEIEKRKECKMSQDAQLSGNT